MVRRAGDSLIRYQERASTFGREVPLVVLTPRGCSGRRPRHPGGVNWLRISSAPCGSRIRRRGSTRSPTTTPRRPEAVARSTAASRSATVKVTDQWAGSPGRGDLDAADHVGEAGWGERLALTDVGVHRGLQVVAVAGDPDHPGGVGVELPAEDRRVEAVGGAEVGRVEVAEVPGAGGVGDLGARSPPRLPQAEAGARRIDAGRRASGGADVLGLRLDRPPGGGDRGGGGVAVVDGDVGVPPGRGLARRDGRRVLPVEGGDEVVRAPQGAPPR